MLNTEGEQPLRDAPGMALKCYGDGCNCAQSVFLSFCERFGVDKDTACGLAAAFGGGMGNREEVCGAVTGALMLIGLRYRRYPREGLAAKAMTRKKARAFVTEFKEVFGAVRCGDLLRTDASRLEPSQKVEGVGEFKKICPYLVAKSVEILGKYLDEQDG